MAMNDEPSIYELGMEQGCPVHGDEQMRECSMCGAEFCRLCFPRSAVCPDCAEQESEDEDEDAPDFDDVERLDDLLDEEDDEEIEEPDEDEADEDDDEGLRRGGR